MAFVQSPRVVPAEPPAPGRSSTAPLGEYRRLTDDILVRMGFSGRGYWVAVGVTAFLALLGVGAWSIQLWLGMGVGGLSHPLMWAIYITGFAWWVGIAHAGTLLSAVLYLFRAPFRAAFSRIAEMMTLVAAVIASLYPIIHLGRAWRFYWLFPYPNQRALWPTFQSPLTMDVAAVVTYLTLSAVFFWLGLLPDLAVVRDRSRGWRRTLYGAFSLGWEGTARQWKYYYPCYTVQAGLLTAFVIFHAGGGWNFSLAIVPGWHRAILPLHFLASALFSGLGMGMLLLIGLRALLRLDGYITIGRLEQVARLTLALSLLVSFSYAVEYFAIWRAGDPIVRIGLLNKMFGPFAPLFWLMTLFNSVVPLLFFWPRARQSLLALGVVSVLILAGMWMERFVVITGSLARGYLPYAWAQSGYSTTWVEWTVFGGSISGFVCVLLLLVRYLPAIPVSEVKRERLKKHRHQEAVDSRPAETTA